MVAQAQAQCGTEDTEKLRGGLCRARLEVRRPPGRIPLQPQPTHLPLQLPLPLLLLPLLLLLLLSQSETLQRWPQRPLA
jgi:hypothetical protein